MANTPLPGAPSGDASDTTDTQSLDVLRRLATPLAELVDELRSAADADLLDAEVREGLEARIRQLQGRVGEVLESGADPDSSLGTDAVHVDGVRVSTGGVRRLGRDHDTSRGQAVSRQGGDRASG